MKRARGIYRTGFLLSFICLFILSGCEETGVTEYRYADGSGNTYRIGDNRTRRVEYMPVKPETSSSGIYDGGAPATKKVTEAQYALIVSSFNRAIAANSSHIKNRVMMSGMLAVRGPRDEKTYILAPGSKERIDIEKILTEIIK